MYNRSQAYHYKNHAGRALVSGKIDKTVEQSMTGHIHRSKREITVMFTDIEDSTRYWGNRGDVNGRLMIDRHNRILFPLVRRYRGRVLKTIGDSIMAMFSTPEAATNCAIAMQQAIQRARDEDKKFKIRIRIGLHIGEGIVERNDVFGDVVNVAARVESEAAGNEILLSGRLSRRLDKTQYSKSQKGSFVPKGKNKPMALYLCEWELHADLLQNSKPGFALPVGQRQAPEILGYGVLGIIALYYFNLHYTRFLLSDNEGLALLFLNPAARLLQYGYFGAALAIGVFGLWWWLMKINKIPHSALRLIKACAAGGGLFIALHAMCAVVPVKSIPGFSTVFYHSSHLFVEVIAAEAKIYIKPDEGADVLREVTSGELMLLTDVRKYSDTTWNKVLLGEDTYGWVKRIQPARLGVIEERLTHASEFQLRYGDIYLLLLSLPAFIWGFRSFHVRPL